MLTTVDAMPIAPLRAGNVCVGENGDTTMVTEPLPVPPILSTVTNVGTLVTIQSCGAQPLGVFVIVTTNVPPSIGTVNVVGETVV